MCSQPHLIWLQLFALESLYLISPWVIIEQFSIECQMLSEIVLVLRFFFLFALRSVIGPENSHYSLNQSDAKLKPLTTWSPSFSRASGSLVVFTQVVSSLLIGSFDHFGFGFNLVLIVSLWLKILYYLALTNLSYFQGALAVEVNLDDKQTIELVSKLIDRDTSICCAAERNFLRTLVSNMILLMS